MMNLFNRLEAAIQALPVKTAEAMAKASYEVVRKSAASVGQSPDSECMLRAPGEPRWYADTTCWCVAWEAGPYDWGVQASMHLGMSTGKLVETYQGFDLMFYPAEDKANG